MGATRMTERCRTQRLRRSGVLLAVAGLMLLSSSMAALAQSVPVTVEVRGPDAPSEPTGPPSEPTSPRPSHAPSPTDTTPPAPPPGEEPPPAAVDPPDDPLARTGTDALRTVRDAAALIAAGLLLLIATRKPRKRTEG